jgi:hypothetical protein
MFTQLSAKGLLRIVQVAVLLGTGAGTITKLRQDFPRNYDFEFAREIRCVNHNLTSRVDIKNCECLSFFLYWMAK